MSGILIAQRYAKALIEIGIKTNTLDALQQELKSLDTLLKTSPDLKRLTMFLHLGPTRQSEIFDAVLEKAGASQLIRHFFQVVTQAARLPLAQQIIESFHDLVDRHNGVIIAQVATVQPLSESQLATLTDILTRQTGKTIRTKLRQDPALLGGLKIQLGSTVYDSSLQGRLRLLKAQLLSA